MKLNRSSHILVCQCLLTLVPVQIAFAMKENISTSFQKLLEMYSGLGYPIGLHLLPGASDAELSELQSRAGGRVRDDQIECLRLHNGVKLEKGVSVVDRWLIPGFCLLSTQEIVEHFESAEIAAGYSDLVGEGWIPIMTDFMGGYVFGHRTGGVAIVSKSGELESKLFHSLGDVFDKTREFGEANFVMRDEELEWDALEFVKFLKK